MEGTRRVLFVLRIVVVVYGLLSILALVYGSKIWTNALSCPQNKSHAQKLVEVSPSPAAVYNRYQFQATTPGAPLCEGKLASSEDIDFTVVMQLSYDRVWLMGEHCRRWGLDNPMSIAFATESNSTTKSSLVLLLQDLGCDTKSMTIILHRGIPADASYPVNSLRNSALSGVKTRMAVIYDVDFLPSPNLYSSLKKHRDFLMHNRRSALVIPAFELRQQCKPLNDEGCRRHHLSMLPDNKTALVDGFSNYSKLPTKKGDKNAPMIVFHGHESTRWEEWRYGQKDDELLPIECLTHDRYEPYLVVQYCQDLPPFQEAFTGYGKNKITWIRHLVRSGYRFYQLGGSFLIHFPHDTSQANHAWKAEKMNATGETLNQTRPLLHVDQIADAFDHWMEDYVPDHTQIPLCRNSTA